MTSLSNMFSLFHEICNPWWAWMWSTYMPRTYIPIGAFYIFAIFVSFFCFFARIALHHQAKKDE